MAFNLIEISKVFLFLILSVDSTEQPETKVMTFEKRSYHENIGESRGRQKKFYKCCEPNLLGATDVQSEHWRIKYKKY